MKIAYRKSIVAGAAVTLMLLGHSANAAVSQDEAAQLGKTLTAIGAEKAGNKDGTIPPYTGGLTTSSADFKEGSGIYPNPFKDEKPLYTITAKNMAQYADKLNEGSKELLKRYPDYRMDIYPTRRTAAFPDFINEATIKNATTAKTTAGGIGLEVGAPGGLPFPIPKTGYEAMWNHLMGYNGGAFQYDADGYYVTPDGRVVLNARGTMHVESPYFQPGNPEQDSVYLLQYNWSYAPGALAGQMFETVDPLDFSQKKREAYQYIPGQRRVKVAPELAYDTPAPGGGGQHTMDDTTLFNGEMDRYNFKLIGKKEIYIPYNMYDFMLTQQSPDGTQKIATAKFINPDLMRWELHRVWVVEATLTDGKRHIYKKRTFYLDEDGYGAGVSDEYDNADKLYRMGFVLPIQMYDRKIQFNYWGGTYDFSNGIYVFWTLPRGPVKAGTQEPGGVKPWSPAEWSSEAMAARGTR